MKPHILIADDDQNILVALKMLLQTNGYQTSLASNPQQVIQLCKDNHFAAILLDLNFQLDTTSGEEGLELLKQIRKLESDLPVIAMTGWASIDLAVEAMKHGAGDFVQKPWDNERLLQIIQVQITLANQVKKSERLSQENTLLKKQQQNDNQLIAESQSMREIMKLTEQVASSDINVMITGENGTGKSILAQYIHQLSERSNGSLISVNMGAISESLFESEMFGHVKGAFTDAKQQRIGRFELADSGSLFLDEIGNIPVSQQGKLLRVLESGEFEKVGASKTQQANCRIISATNAELTDLIKEGGFRQDLLYRLNSIEIRLPPLRERQQDIIPLANHFLAKFRKKYSKANLSFTESAQKSLKDYRWPGNIRELSHAIERAVILAADLFIDRDLLPLSADSQSTNSQSNNDQQVSLHDCESTLDELEKQIIQQRISYYKGNMQLTAKSLGLSRSAFYRRIDKYQL